MYACLRQLQKSVMVTTRVTLSRSIASIKTIKPIDNKLISQQLARYLSLSAKQQQQGGAGKQQEVKVTFVCANGEKLTSKGKVGDSLLDVVVNNNVDLDGFGACEGTLTCSTCHLIFKQQDYDKLPNTPSDEELDMLDLAFDLTDTSRLGCQITLTPDMDGLEVQVPATINDARST